MVCILDPDALTLLVVLDANRHEQRAANEARPQFGLMPVPSGYVWLATWWGLASLDAPFNPHILPSDKRNLPIDEAAMLPDSRLALTVAFAHRSGVRWRVLNRVTLSPPFTRELLTIHKAALAEPYSPTIWSKAMADYEQTYPTVYDAMRATQIKCSGETERGESLRGAS